MENIVRVKDMLINVTRLITIVPRPYDVMPEGSYLAIFDTGQKLTLTSEQADALMTHLPQSPPASTL